MKREYDTKDAIHDLKALKDYFEQETGATPVCLNYAIAKLKEMQEREKILKNIIEK